MNSFSLAALVWSALAVIALTSFSVSAQEAPACGDEIDKFCSHVVPGRLSMVGCLNEHREALSGECLAKVDKALVKIEQARKICGADISKFCADVKPGEGRIINCLTAKKENLAPECRKQVEKFAAPVETRRNAPSENRTK